MDALTLTQDGTPTTVPGADADRVPGRRQESGDVPAGSTVAYTPPMHPRRLVTALGASVAVACLALEPRLPRELRLTPA